MILEHLHGFSAGFGDSFGAGLSSDIYYGKTQAALLTFREELAAELRHDAKSRLVWPA
jgi:hypothetical protein